MNVCNFKGTLAIHVDTVDYQLESGEEVQDIREDRVGEMKSNPELT